MIEARSVRVGVLGLAAALVGLDAGSFGPTLPALRAGLGLDDPRAAWLLSAYVVGTLLGNPANAWVNARWGPARALSAGLAVYAAGALLVALAQGNLAACAGRGLQGVGAGSLLPIATATLAAMVAVGRRGRAIMLLSLVYAATFLLATATASIVGASAWRLIYVGLAALGLASAALTARLLPSDPPAAPAPLDLRGLVLWSATVAAMAVVVPQLKGGTLAGPALGLALAVAAGGFAASVASARGVAQPFVPLGLLRDRAVRGACVLSLAVGAAQVFAVSLPSFAAVVVGIPTPRVGLWSLPFVVSGALGTAFAALVIDRLGARRVVLVTGSALVLGAGSLVYAPGSPLVFALLSSLLGLGLCTLSGGPIRHLVGVLEGADGARSQALLALVTNLGLLAGSAVYGALASPHGDLARRGDAMRAGTAAIALLVAAGLALGLRMLPAIPRASRAALEPTGP